jgi:DnaJ-class molecular chaperone
MIREWLRLDYLHFLNCNFPVVREYIQREGEVGMEKMPNGRRMESAIEDETCPKCRGKGTTGDSPNTVRMCGRCSGRGKVRALSAR